MEDGKCLLLTWQKPVACPQEPRGALYHRKASQTEFRIAKCLPALINKLHNASLGKECLNCEFEQKKKQVGVFKK